MAGNATTEAACIITLLYAGDPRQLIVPSVTPEPNFHRTAEPNLPETAGPKLRCALTDASESAASTDRAIHPAEVGTPTIVPAEAL